MEKVSPAPSANDRIRVAFEACCGALRALELAYPGSDQEDAGHRHVARAIALLRETTLELRLLQGEGSNELRSGSRLQVQSEAEEREPTG